MDSSKCPICLGYFKSTPLVLQCGHEICFTCVEKLGSSILTCPLCPIQKSQAANSVFEKDIEKSRDSQRQTVNEAILEEQNRLLGQILLLVGLLILCVITEAVFLGFFWIKHS
ncbi:hypothetical protein L596_027201 [Steinernema carpocapsae]|uniref:RING-type domain-containing protein n=1 Tax=Steinernema carpocapsae TaxID=34508 RepID=A0A4U5M3M0_STECR|nr:hypothetical protein L596_027201 [Steinernema carpocapsae]